MSAYYYGYMLTCNTCVHQDAEMKRNGHTFPCAKINRGESQKVYPITHIEEGTVRCEDYIVHTSAPLFKVEPFEDAFDVNIEKDKTDG